MTRKLPARSRFDWHEFPNYSVCTLGTCDALGRTIRASLERSPTNGWRVRRELNGKVYGKGLMYPEARRLAQKLLLAWEVEAALSSP